MTLLPGGQHICSRLWCSRGRRCTVPSVASLYRRGMDVIGCAALSVILRSAGWPEDPAGDRGVLETPAEDVAATSTIRNVILNAKTATENLKSGQIVEGNERLNLKQTNLFSKTGKRGEYRIKLTVQDCYMQYILLVITGHILNFLSAVRITDMLTFISHKHGNAGCVIFNKSEWSHLKVIIIIIRVVRSKQGKSINFYCMWCFYF